MRSWRLSPETRRALLKRGSVGVLLLLVTGCATFDQRAGFSEVRATVEDRSGLQVRWNHGTALDAQAARQVSALLADELTVDAAVQVALLNNRDLQALYAELGVAQADLVQAGLLRNPIFDGGAFFPLTGGQPDLELGVALSFLDIFYRPLRKRVAAAQFEAAKLQVTGAVLDFTATVRAAFYRHQANEQMLEMRQTIVQALTASLEAARLLHAAGNITDLDLARERALAEAAKLQLQFAETAVRQGREALNALMGLWGPDTAWDMARRLPDVPASALPLEGLEQRVIRQSLDLASARQRIIVAGEQLGVNRATALIPELHLGPRAERDEGEWDLGPVLEFPIPLFDQGQARVGRASVGLRQAQQAYYALAVRIRSTARAVRDRLQGTRERAVYYRDILLPLRERVVNETQLHYNAMQLGVFELLRAREQQIQTAVVYIETLLAYWLARTDLDHMLSGRLPRPAEVAMRSMTQPANMTENATH
jgi:cobalt-zinc-cadmium efflux system outer membrane protein